VASDEFDMSDVHIDPDSAGMEVSEYEVEKAIRKLSCHKSCGLDGIYAEHLKYASRRLLKLLALCVSSCFTHGFLPDDMISVVLVPIIKNKAGNINSKDNYRPIALASVLSKVVENILLVRLEDYLVTHDNQFGFKRKHGTDQCIYVLKEVVDAYRAMNSSLFLCFLDASKAFDRVNHCTLFRKLRDRGVPGYIIRIIVFWYSHQQMCVRWNNITSHPFNVCNGVRQGGILSPYLFNAYVDDLSSQLNVLPIGCYVGNVCVNHLMYADDIVLIAPSAAGLQKLVLVCEQFGASHDVLYNSKKSFTMIVKSTLLKDARIPHFKLNNTSICETECTKYLGHFINSSFSDNNDILRQTRMLYAQGNILLRKFHMCSLNVKSTLFKTYCSSMYTAHLWWNHSKMIKK
jgi:hypothetical protein